MNNPFIAVLMGSDSDLPVMQVTLNVLKSLELPFEVQITSAHRTPEATARYVKEADARGCGVFIAAAGLAAHLAGAVAANTLKPVIGVPMAGGPLNGSFIIDGADAWGRSRSLCCHWQSGGKKRCLSGSPNFGA
jgi:5-(carboxyamino)imidazole ribonucleotide mutase